MAVLLDANVLIALAIPDHVHVEAAEAWLQRLDQPVATCPVTQGSLIRALMREGHTAAAAWRLVSRIASLPNHEFWPDSLSYVDVPLTGVIGHRQVTDAYLAHLARSRGGRLATFDRGLAALHPDVVELVPTA